MPLATSIKTSLERAAARYAAQLNHAPDAQAYLGARGIDQQTAVTYRLGVVLDPEGGHEHLAGRLVLPYVTRAGVVEVRFRCLEAHDHNAVGCPKYLGSGGERTRLYNVNAFFRARDVVAVAEGEVDALTADGLAGIPTVGVPGVNNWKQHHPRCFAGYSEVIVFADGDQAGRDFAKRVRNDVSQARIVSMPDGEDVNSVYVTQGRDALRRMAGLA